MTHERIEAVWIEEHRALSLDELDERWGLAASRLQAFVELGILAPDAAAGGQPAFTLETVAIARTACRLQEELDLEPHAVGVVLALLDRMRRLESELASLRAELAATSWPQDG